MIEIYELKKQLMSEQQIVSVPVAQLEVKSEAPYTQPGAIPSAVKKPRRNRKNRMAKKAS